MIRTNFYTGLPVDDKPNLVDVQTVDQKNIMQQFSTDPNQRMEQMNAMQQYQQPINPFQPAQSFGGYAGNPVFQTGPGVGYYQQPIYNAGGYGYNNGMYNPALQFNNLYAGFQPRIQDQNVHVPGLNFGSDILLTSDMEEQCAQMQLDMMVEQEEAIAKRNQRFQGYFNNNGYTNYYGMPFYSSYQDVSVTRKYTDKINELRQEARQRRIDFNKNLSRMVHNYLGEEIPEEQLDMIYEGYDYTIPANVLKVQSECSRFSRMVPVTNQPMYAKQFQELQDFYKGINPDNNMNGFLQSLGVVHACDELAQELHNRRDTSQLYSSDSYKRYLHKSIMERNGINPSDSNNPNTVNPNLFPTLSSASKLLDDGTLSISPPSWMSSGSLRRIQVNNEMEQHFEENRRAFLESIYAQGK